MKTNDVKAGLHRGLHRQGPVRRPQHQRAAPVRNKLRELQAAGVKSQTVAIGNKGFGFLNRIGAQVVSHVTQLGDTPHLDKLIGPVKVLLDAPKASSAPCTTANTRFINTMRQEPVVEQLLP